MKNFLFWAFIVLVLIFIAFCTIILFASFWIHTIEGLALRICSAFGIVVSIKSLSGLLIVKKSWQ